MSAPTPQPITLAGCSTQPLASYLKSIGVFRILSEQFDPALTGAFVDDRFVVCSTRTVDDIVGFLVSSYSPTPILNPWNNGSGFAVGDEKKSPAAFAAVNAVAESTHERFDSYRKAIGVARQRASDDSWADLEKEQQVALLRSSMPDEALDWLDAAVVLTSDSRSFPPLLGTGGNDGRLDFGKGFMERVAAVTGLGKKPLTPQRVEALLRDALLGTSTAALTSDSLGQFDPSGAGGPRSAPDGKATSLANPWDLVLLFEGAVAFVSGVARRFGASAAVASVPFTVRSSPVGYASKGDEKSRGEFWAPLWRQQAAYRTIAHTFAEGRVEYSGRQARSGLDAARALASFGVDRGVEAFVRYGFVERNGLATFAVPLGRVAVRHSDRVDLLSPIDRWIAGFRSDRAPSSATAAVVRVDEAMLRVASDDTHDALLDVLDQLASLEQIRQRSSALQERINQAPRRLKASDWLPMLADGTAEFDVAVALASLRRAGSATGLVHAAVIPSTDGRPAKVAGFGHRSFDDVMGEVIAHIARDTGSGARGNGKPEAADVPWCGQVRAVPCQPSSFVDLAGGQLDEHRLTRLLRALMLLDWRADPAAWAPPVMVPVHAVPPPVALTKVTLHHRSVSNLLAGRPAVASKAATRNLAAGRWSVVIDETMRTLRIADLQPNLGAHQIRADDLTRQTGWNTALLVPIHDGVLASLARLVTTFDPPDVNPDNPDNSDRGST